jgi:hypothetical protein
MVEFLAFYILCGVLMNIVAILRFNANPPALEVIGAILMWPLVLLTLIQSFGKKDEDGHE